MISKKLNKCISFAVSIIMLLGMISTVNLTSFAAGTQDIVNNGDMENSTYWWHSNGGEPVVSVSDVKHSGSYSIKATGRENPWEGAAQNLTGNQKGDPVAGIKYHGTAWIMFDGETAPDSVTFKLSIKRNNGTEDKYDNINSAAVTKGQWTLLEGDYTLPADTVVSEGVHIYLETTESESFVDFYADDISLTTEEPASTASPSATATSPVPTPSGNPDKLVALTFDDGPDNTLTSLVLDKLEKYNVPATFMMVGSKINDTTAPTVKRVIDLGCEIGNHSWTYSGMDKMTAEQIQKSVNDTSAAIEKYSGTKPLFFRPPNLALSDTMYDAIDLTFVSGVTANDWDQSTTADQRADAIINGVKDGSIVLLHDVQPLPHPTAEALDKIIPTLISKGYEFVTLSELFKRKGVELDSTKKVMYSQVTGSTPTGSGKDIVNNGDIENGTNWWYNRGSASIAASSDVKHGGNSSLMVTGRTSSWQGPAQNLVGNEKGDPVAEKPYSGAAWVMFDGETVPETVTFKLSVQWNDGTDDHYDQVSQVEVTKGQWTKLEGTYTIPSEAVLEKGVHLYIETTESESFVDFYLDDISFKEPGSTVSLNGSDSMYTDFETGDLSGWTNRGEEAVAVTDAEYHNGSYSIAATGRTQSWNGPQHTLMGVVNFDKSYQFSAYVMYKDGPDTQSIQMSIQKDSGSGTDYINLGSVTATKGKWALIEGEYTVTYDPTLTNIGLYFEAPGSTLVDFYLDDVKVTGGDSLDFDPSITSLHSVWDQYFPLGAAISPDMLESPIYNAYINKHYSSLTPGNCMKPDAIQPTEGKFTFTDTDKIAAFAEANNKLLRGHTLLWHNQIPAWFFTDPQDSTKPATSEMLLGRLKTHIEAVMTHYKGKIHTYDVVNEVLSDISGLRGDDENSKWKSIVGDVDKDGVDDDYILAAFKYAFETARKIGDDNVKFCINDYNLESSTKKLDEMYNITKRILKVADECGMSKGRIVVGFQMHISIYSPSVDQIRLSIEKIASLGVKVQVTELDMSIYKSSSEPKKTATEDIFMLQAKRYKDVFEIFKDEALKGNLDTVTIWGVDDGESWLNDFPVKGRPDPALLFNRRLQAKPAYTALTDPDKLPVYKQQMISYKGAPVIDNDIDNLWDAIKWVDVNQYISGTEGATTKIKTMWDGNDLYILAQINDSTPNAKDCLEMFVDTNLDTPEDNKHYTLMLNGIKRNADGYLLETVVSLTGTTIKQGDKIGIDFRVSDYATNGKLSSVVVWNDNKSKLDNYPTGLGYLLFDKEVKLINVNKGTPVIDGSIDSIWKDVQANETDTWVNGTSGSTATFKTLWENGKLYVLAEVTDSLLSKASSDAYQQDSVEIFIDQDNAKNSYYESDDYQIRINFDNEVSYNPGELAGFKSATSKTETGYIVEAEIPLTATTAKEGNVLGFDLQVNNDEDGDGSRDSVSIWCDPTGFSYKDVSNFGNIILGGIASETKVAGYINPGFNYTSSQAASILPGFKVELEGTGLSALTDENGYFEIQNIQSGKSYNLLISKKGYLTRKIFSVKVNGSKIIGSKSAPIAIWAGDIPVNNVQDNAINMIDAMQIAKAFGLTATDTGFISYLDFDKDNSISIADVIIMAKNFNNNITDYPSIQ
ncbi:endo-1,4-beta-xylanase [Pseudobacteroides cellulosolvens]|uniref:Beta-xylanase n=1 Tax=Pseudobacteroides cellulosolvens ATCC 35603 = DSM 2933 TaxID=398512 RepID=A0A0L6JKD1_9FIRM|nr:endo-1,4-beta-xylanase [Pseudobacteroides cellulosolvens]KNY26224.1 Endo-1,4-beta-xylanase [Pseudobacteroides cellulosolvens ATCC 35603 = DSM 2933]